jgi:hypothetical protein
MACSFLSNLRPVSPSERGHLCPYVYCLVHPRLLPAGFSGLLLCHRPHSLRCGGQLVTIPLGPQVLRWTEGEREKEEEKAKSFGDKGKGKKGAGRRGEQFHGLPVPSQHAIVPGTSVMWGPVLSGDTPEVPPQLSKIPRGEFLEGWAPLSGEIKGDPRNSHPPCDTPALEGPFYTKLWFLWARGGERPATPPCVTKEQPGPPCLSPCFCCLNPFEGS